MTVKRIAFAAVVVLGAVLVSMAPAGATDDSRPSIDRNGDGIDALAVTRVDGNNDFVWFFQDNGGITFGSNAESDRLVPGDYDGDGKIDAAVLRPGSPARWIIALSSGGFVDVAFGDTNLEDRPVPADYDGDGKTDIAVIRPGAPAITWFAMLSSDGFMQVPFGNSAEGDDAVPADFDCDGKADLAVRRPGASVTDPTEFFVMSSHSGVVAEETFGQGGDFYVPGDYDGDGCADLMVTRIEDGHFHWYADTSAQGFFDVPWGDSGGSDQVIAGDYNGDGRSDIAVVRGSTSHFVLLARDSATGALITSPIFGDTATDSILNDNGLQGFS